MEKQTKYPRRRESWFTKCGVGILLLAMFLCVVGLIAQNLFNYRFFVSLILIIATLIILGTVITVIGLAIDLYKDKHDK